MSSNLNKPAGVDRRGPDLGRVAAVIRRLYAMMACPPRGHPKGTALVRILTLRLIVAGIVGLAMAGLQPPQVSAIAPRLQLDPPAGPVGASVHLVGTGFAPLSGVSLRFGVLPPSDGDCRDSKPAASLTPAFSDERGDFDATVLVPRLLDVAAPSSAPACLLASGAPGYNVQASFALQGSPPGDTATCYFVLGFAALRALIPTTAGACVDDERHDPDTGDGLQHTTTGLMVWRKVDNYTAFTDGYHTWVDGRYGLETRLNGEYLPWEAGGSGAGDQLVAPEATDALLGYFGLLDRGDFAGAYALWSPAPQPYAAYVAGFADTLQTAVRVGSPLPDSAMGYFGVDLPAVLIARHADGSTVAYAGCYTLETLKVQPGVAALPWRIAAARVRPAPAIAGFDTDQARSALASACA